MFLPDKPQAAQKGLTPSREGKGAMTPVLICMSRRPNVPDGHAQAAQKGLAPSREGKGAMTPVLTYPGGLMQ